ncbi:hypothetical protein L1S45_14315 [Aeromonas dhakensis]|uniref:hypothetical protein n=1 Tax=Aeromonas dhakensis TaxID=196024 RepID=UPI00208EA5BF|nr:hypothetical protein [Aeromonas dhakensis]USP08349.1 hypothetical protein L1S45_14315 [Aeromonas dhakensis]
MKYYFIVAGLLFAALTLHLVWLDHGPQLGVGGYLATFIFGTLFTGGGMSLGELFRRFTRPDWIVTGSATATFKTKLFWMMGPQAIGGFIGFMAFQSFMSNILGYAV